MSKEVPTMSLHCYHQSSLGWCSGIISHYEGCHWNHQKTDDETEPIPCKQRPQDWLVGIACSQPQPEPWLAALKLIDLLLKLANGPCWSINRVSNSRTCFINQAAHCICPLRFRQFLFNQWPKRNFSSWQMGFCRELFLCCKFNYSYRGKWEMKIPSGLTFELVWEYYFFKLPHFENLFCITNKVNNVNRNIV